MFTDLTVERKMCLTQAEEDGVEVKLLGIGDKIGPRGIQGWFVFLLWGWRAK